VVNKRFDGLIFYTNNMNFPIITRKLFYYGEWYASLTKEEKSSQTGEWVRERLERFSEAIADDLKETANPLRSGADTIGIP
jgi:hypothetical protein